MQIKWVGIEVLEDRGILVLENCPFGIVGMEAHNIEANRTTDLDENFD
jgi:hypothetical protein